MRRRDDGETTASWETARAAVLRHGYNSNAYLVLSPPPFQFFAAPGIDGVVAYQQYGSVWLCGGDPLCAPDDLVPLVQALRRAARRARKMLAFLPVTGRAAAVMTDRLGFDHVKVGEDRFYDVQEWSTRGQKMKHIRANINRAEREGVTVRRCHPADVSDDIRNAVGTLIAGWFETRGMSALSFLLGVQPFALMDDRRLYLAWREGRIVGFLSCSPIPARDGWYLEDSIRSDTAPVGTNELLFAATMADLRSWGARRATLGMAALANSGAAHQPPAHHLAGWVFTQMYRRLDRFYRFESLQFAKEKYGPVETDEMFFVWSPRGLWRPRLIRAVLYALDPEGFTAALTAPVTHFRRQRARLRTAAGRPNTEVFSPLPNDGSH